MNKLLVFIFAGIIVSTATAVVNPVKPLADLFKNGAIPSVATLNAAVEESIRYVIKLFYKKITPQPDMYGRFIDEYGRLIKVKLTNGQLTGTETTYRIGDASSTIQKIFAGIGANFGYRNLTITYNYEVKRTGLRRDGQVIAQGSDFICHVGFLVHRTTLKISSYNVHCENTGPIDIIKLQGRTKDRIKKMVIDSIPIIKNLIAKAVTRKMVKVITDVLNRYNASFKIGPCCQS